MMKSEAENMIRRAMEDNEALDQFTEKQIQILAQALMKISGRMIEEAFSSFRPGVQGSRPTFFTE